MLVALERHFSGPLPSPDMLRQYEELLPGCAERIVGAWESETVHRRALENRGGKIEGRGQIMAFVLAVLFLAGSMFLAYWGHAIEGISVLIAEIAALAFAFMYDRRGGKKPPDES
jgi:uncharacterized membrane protein